jgi:hypothetical protein
MKTRKNETLHKKKKQMSKKMVRKTHIQETDRQINITIKKDTKRQTDSLTNILYYQERNSKQNIKRQYQLHKIKKTSHS